MARFLCRAGAEITPKFDKTIFSVADNQTAALVSTALDASIGYPNLRILWFTGYTPLFYFVFGGQMFPMACQPTVTSALPFIFF